MFIFIGFESHKLSSQCMSTILNKHGQKYHKKLPSGFITLQLDYELCEGRTMPTMVSTRWPTLSSTQYMLSKDLWVNVGSNMIQIMLLTNHLSICCNPNSPSV